MSAVLVNDTTMTEIADAIREKSGITEQMLPNEMAGKIQSISQGEKRIIPTKMITSSTSTVYNGMGTLYIPNGISRYFIDNKSHSMNISSPSDTMAIGYGYSIKFNNSCKVDSDGIVGVVGHETNSLLTGSPSEVYAIYNHLMPSTGFTVNGKGYALCILINSKCQSGAITIDGTKITSNFSISGGNRIIRLDFDTQLKIEDMKLTNPDYSLVWMIYVWK